MFAKAAIAVTVCGDSRNDATPGALQIADLASGRGDHVSQRLHAVTWPGSRAYSAIWPMGA
jgi:hypothetical protein